MSLTTLQLATLKAAINANATWAAYQPVSITSFTNTNGK